jgi:iron-sulfur cluster assembly accessory protein
MVTISDEAIEKAKQILTVEKKQEWGLRIYVAGSSCCGPSFGMDLLENPMKDDQVVEKNGLRLFLEKNASEKLDGMEIHFMDDGEKSGFLIRGNQPMPGSKDASAGPGSCSCG